MVWKNVHCNMLQYKVQSKLWELMNLNFITSFSLNRMYNTGSTCLQCNLPEENSFHILFSCQIIQSVIRKFTPILNAISQIDINNEEIAFGLIISNEKLQKDKLLRNYITSIIKYIIFKNRAIIQQTIEQKIESIYKKITCFIKSDLKLKFLFAKKYGNIVKLKEKFLINNIIAEYNEERCELNFNI